MRSRLKHITLPLLWLIALGHAASLRAQEPAGALPSAATQPLQMPEAYFPQLRELLDAALEQSPRMVLARLEVEAAEGGATQARAGLYPMLSTYSRAALTSDIRRDLPGSTETTKLYYDVALTQPVFHWGERRNNARIGEIRVAMAERQYAEGYRLLAREIRQGYLSLVVQKSQLATARFGREQAAEALRAGEARSASGSLAPGALFGLQIALEQAQLAADSLALAFSQAREQLEQLAGVSVPAEAELPDELPELTIEPRREAALAAALQSEAEPSHAALEPLRQQVEVDRLTYKNQKLRLRPKLSLVLGISQDEQSYTLNNAQRYGVTSRYVGLQVNWAIFDGWATRGAKRAALAHWRASQARYEQAAAAARRQAQASASALSLAQRQAQISERLLRSSVDYLQKCEEGFAAGRNASDTVAQARSGYYHARAAANAARLNVLMGEVDLASQLERDPLPVPLQSQPSQR